MDISNEIIKKSLEFGATTAGCVPAIVLKNCPSAIATGIQGFSVGTGTIVVLGLYHDPARPEMDWWERKKYTWRPNTLPSGNTGI